MRHHFTTPQEPWMEDDAFFRRILRANERGNVYWGAVKTRGRTWEYATDGHVALARAVTRVSREYAQRGADENKRATKVITGLIHDVPSKVGIVLAEDVEAFGRRAVRADKKAACLQIEDQDGRRHGFEAAYVEIMARGADQPKVAAYMWKAGLMGLGLRTVTYASFLAPQGVLTARCVDTEMVLPVYELPVEAT
jgi:hypothetical protein